MSDQKELDELFAYLDQLELNERLEQQQETPLDPCGDRISSTSTPVPWTVQEEGKADTPWSNHGTTAAQTYRNESEKTERQDLGTVSRGGIQGAIEVQGMYLLSKIADDQRLPNNLLPSTLTSAPSTPPKRRTVQFDSATPLRTPQRKAPKLVFTPLRPVHPANQPEPTEILCGPAKAAFEGVVLSPADSSFLRSFVPVDPGSQSISNSSDEDSDREITNEELNCSPSASSMSLNEMEDVQEKNLGDSDFPSPSQPTQRPRKQTKKRVVYSSDEDCEEPVSGIQQATGIHDVPEIEWVGGIRLAADTHVLVDEPKTPPQKSRPRSAKAKGVSKYIDSMARAAGRDEEEDSDDAGSLDDFIVDDDYVEYEDNDEEGENLDNAYVLTYSPTTPKPKRAATQITSSPVDLTETSDEDTSKVTIPAPAPPARPKPRARPPPAKAVETPKKSRSEKKDWKDNKQKMAQQIMDELDELVFEGKLVKEWKVFPAWNNKLLTTAGRAHHKRVKLAGGGYRHEGRIELSEKVIDDEDKLKNTVAHEMCHLATWIISEEMKNPHGAVFKSWGKKVMKARKDITVITKHSYEIAYKYEWECTTEGCDAIYRRHSKSIDIDTHGCGKCRGKLRPLFKTRGAGSGSTPFQEFLKQNMKLAKTAMPKATHGDVMRALSERWKASGGAKTPTQIMEMGEDPLAVQRGHAEYWRDLSLRMQTLAIA